MSERTADDAAASGGATAALGASVIVPARGPCAHLPECIEAIQAARLGGGALEVIVVDDASDAPLEAQHPLPGVRWVRLDERSGAGAARNAGARRAAGEVLFFVDADGIVGPETFTRLLAPLRAGEAQVTQAVYDPSRHASDSFASYRNDFEAYKLRHARDDRLGSFNSFAFACLREFWESSGGFVEWPGADDRCEDVEWGHRILAAGATILRVPGARVVHLHEYGLRSFFLRQLFTSASMLRLYLALPARRRRARELRLAGMPRYRSLPFAISGLVVAALLASLAWTAAAVALGGWLPPAVAFGASLAGYLAIQAPLLALAGLRRAPVILAVGLVTGVAFAAGMVAGVALQLARPLRVPDVGDA